MLISGVEDLVISGDGDELLISGVEDLVISGVEDCPIRPGLVDTSHPLWLTPLGLCIVRSSLKYWEYIIMNGYRDLHIPYSNHISIIALTLL